MNHTQVHHPAIVFCWAGVNLANDLHAPGGFANSSTQVSGPGNSVAGLLLWTTLAVLIFLSGTGCDRTGSQNPPPPDAISGTPESTTNDSEFQAVLNRAVGMMGQFKYQEAYELLSGLSASRPDDLDLAVNSAIARLNMAGDNDLQAALKILEEVIVRQPRHLRANYCAGLLKTYLGPPADPLPNFRIANELDPNDSDVVFLYAKSLEQSGELESAKTEYLRCLLLNEYYASAMLGLGRIGRMNSDMEAAKNWLEQFESMKANPNCRIFEFAYKRMGKYGEVAAAAGAAVPAPRVLPAGSIFGQPRQIPVNGAMANLENFFSNSGTVAVITPVDLNQDRRIDLLVHARGEKETPPGLVALLNDGMGNFNLLENNPWSNIADIRAVLCGDVDQNGTVDLYLCRKGNNQLWTQTAGGQWQLTDDVVVAGGEFDTVDGMLCDSDHDGDLDIVCANGDGSSLILGNNRDGSWRVLETGVVFARPAAWVAAGDFDNDRDLDLLLGGQGDVPAVLWNERLWQYRTDETVPPGMVLPDTVSAIAQDIDDDGWIDIVQQRDGRFEIWSRQSSGDWNEKQPIAPGSADFPMTSAAFAAVDLNGDGTREFLIAGDDGLLVCDDAGKELERMKVPQEKIAGWNLVAIDSQHGWSVICLDQSGKLWEFPPGAGRHDFVAVEFSGKESLAESMRSNRSGIGTRWKARIGSGWTAGTGFSPDSFWGQSCQPELIGLRGFDQVDFIAVDWSDGVFQTELALQPGSVLKIEETQRQLASCPLVFAWNGERMEFVTDVLGVGGMGFMVEPGVYAPPRPWENLLLTASQLQPRDGRLEIKIGEPMEEACYVQSAKLVAVDVPDGWQMVIDERMGITDPQPTGEPCFFRREYPVIAARDRSGQDQVAALLDADGTPAQVGELDHRFIGLLAEEQSLEFSFGDEIGTGGRPALIIDGWLEYPYSQTVFGAWQAGRGYNAPSLEVSVDGKNWELAWEQFGYPAGMPRTMMLPLPEKATGKLWFRFRSEMQIYWDRIRLVYLEECPDAKTTGLKLEQADLRRSGFAQRITRDWFNPWYDYSVRKGTWDSRHLPGFYTRLGKITELMADDNGALAIFGPGEEIHLEFVAAPGLQAGWHRVHMLKLKGWCKDLDIYTENGNSLGPLPDFLRSSPDPARSAELHQKYNWRYESGPWFPVTPDLSSHSEFDPEGN